MLLVPLLAVPAVYMVSGIAGGLASANLAVDRVTVTSSAAICGLIGRATSPAWTTSMHSYSCLCTITHTTCDPANANNSGLTNRVLDVMLAQLFMLVRHHTHTGLACDPASGYQSGPTNRLLDCMLAMHSCMCCLVVFALSHKGMCTRRPKAPAELNTLAC